MEANPKRNLEDIGSATTIEEKVVKESGDIATRCYNKGRFLGKGSFARCYEFINLETLKLSAVKIVPKDSLKTPRGKQKLMSEIKIHQALNHPNIVEFENFFEDNENVYILLEICTNKTMNEFLRCRKRLTEPEVQCYLLQLISALQYLHNNKVIHRDLKLGHLFLSDKMEIKIGDFGSATKIGFKGERKRTICGTANYIAPEILAGKNGHSYEVDIWSFGVIAYTLLVGKPPFETPDVKNTYRRILKNAYEFPDSILLSEASKNLITRILVCDPAQRPSLDEILAHEFFHQGNPAPRLMPLSTLACPPSTSLLGEFKSPSLNDEYQSPNKLDKTVPSFASRNVIEKVNRQELANTERISKFCEETKQLPQPSDAPEQETGIAGPEVWVKKWVDYSSEYGLGYLLSNGAAGVIFHDATKIILGPTHNRFEYIEKGSENQSIVVVHTLTEFPEELKQKITLLQSFISSLEGDAKQEAGLEDENAPMNHVYVKKWMKTRYAIMFKFSNKIVQANFKDHTEIILFSETRVVTYTNKLGERSTYPLATAQDRNNQEMIKRLKYTKDILTHMLDPNKEESPIDD